VQGTKPRCNVTSPKRYEIYPKAYVRYYRLLAYRGRIPWSTAFGTWEGGRMSNRNGCLH